MKRKEGKLPEMKLASSHHPQYEINWDAVKTVKDLKGIMQTFEIVFTTPPANVDHIKHLVIKIQPK